MKNRLIVSCPVALIRDSDVDVIFTYVINFSPRCSEVQGTEVMREYRGLLTKYLLTITCKIKLTQDAHVIKMLIILIINN